MRVGNFLKYLKKGWNRKEGGGGELGQGVGALKKGGWKPLTNYEFLLDIVQYVYMSYNIFLMLTFFALNISKTRYTLCFRI